MSIQSTKTFLMKWEHGDYVPRPGSFDPNPTRDGIIQKTYDKYRARKKLASRSVFDAPQAEWDLEWWEIFEAGFYRPAGCHLLPDPLDLVVADAAFNSGPKQSVKFLQRAVGTVPDGVFGPKTKEAVLRANVREVVISVIGQRIRFLKALHARSVQAGEAWDATPAESRQGPRPQPAPLKGWLNRVKDLQRAAGV
jgi:lysozyme family protein